MQWRVLEIMTETGVLEGIEADSAAQACEAARELASPEFDVESVKRIAVPEGNEFPDVIAAGPASFTPEENATIVECIKATARKGRVPDYQLLNLAERYQRAVREVSNV